MLLAGHAHSHDTVWPSHYGTDSYQWVHSYAASEHAGVLAACVMSCCECSRVAQGSCDTTRAMFKYRLLHLTMLLSLQPDCP